MEKTFEYHDPIEHKDWTVSVSDTFNRVKIEDDSMREVVEMSLFKFREIVKDVFPKMCKGG